MTLQARTGGTWRTVAHYYPKTGKTGTTSLTIKGTHAVGSMFRIATTWTGDADHVKNQTGWLYYRFTK